MVRVRGHYVPANVKSILISITPSAGGGAQTFNADLTQGANKDCSGTPLACTLTIQIAPGSYVGKFATFDGLLFGGNAPGNPPTGNPLSANQDVPMAIVAGRADQINLTLGAIPAEVNIAALGSNIGTNGNGDYVLSPSYASAQVQVTALDSDFNTIVGPGAPTMSMKSDDTSHLSVAQIGTSNTFTLTSPVKPALGLIAHLTATATPVDNTGIAPVVGSAQPVLFGVPVIEFPISAATGYDLQGIAAGSDGNMWFTLINESEIGRILVSNPATVNYFPTKTSSVYPTGITAGPSDSNLWFNEGSQAGRIGKIPTSETPGSSSGETEYAVTNGGAAGFQSMTTGTDGNVWFVDSANNAIGKMTTAGVVTEFTLSVAGAFPSAITSGPGNTMWFTECGSSYWPARLPRSE